MKKKSILNITIREICECAGISRPTFYTHFKDQYDLLQSIEIEISAYFEDIVFVNKTKKLSKREITVKIEEVLQYIESNSNSVQVLLGENGDINFQKKFFRCYVEYVQHSVKNYIDKEFDREIGEYYSVFTVQGMIAIIQRWLKNNMNIPKGKLALIITELIRAV
jgi:AcrR family transcriptional regulator